MSLLKESWRRFKYGLAALAIALVAVMVATPAIAMADEDPQEPYVLTPDTHWFIGQSHDRQPWPDEDGSPLEYPFTVQEDRIVVWFLMEADDADAPKGYVLWQLFDESGKEVFSAYLIGFGYGYATNYFGFTLDKGTYTQRLTQVGCEGTECSICLGAYTDPDTWVPTWPKAPQPITVGSTVGGTFTDYFNSADGDSVDVKRYFKDFSFTLNEPTYVEFSAQPNDDETQLSLLDSDGALLKSATGPYDAELGQFAAYDLNCGRLEAGAYYLRYETLEASGGNRPVLNREFTLSAKAARELYRLYNPYTGEHLYTVSADERDARVADGWNDEGVMGYAPLTSAYPVYRLFNPDNGDHHYASTVGEYDRLASLGWEKEGVAFYSKDDPTASEYDGIAVGRFFNSYNEGPGAHHFVRLDGNGQTEYEQLIKAGWRYEGTGWTGMAW